MNTPRLVTSIATLVVLVACAQGPTQEEMAKAGLEPMSQSEVEAFLANRTIAGVDEKGTAWTVFFAPDGILRGSANWTGGSGTDQGVWSVAEDGTYCRKFDEWRDGQEGCWRLYDDGTKVNLIRVSGNAINQTTEGWKIREGNPDNL